MVSRSFQKKLPVYFIASYIFFIGINFVLSILVGLKNHDIARTVGSPTQSVLLGIGLIYLSAGLIRGLFRAWLITLSLIFLGIAREFILLSHTLDLTNLVLLLVAGVTLFLLRDEFKAQSEEIRLRGNILISLLIILLTMAYGTIGFHQISEHSTKHEFTFSQGLAATVREFSLSKNRPAIEPQTRRTEAFLLSLRALGVVSSLLVGYSVLQPLIYKAEHRDDERDMARELLEQYGGNSEDYFKLWPNDKSYLFTDDKSAAIAYKVRRNIALSAGDPFGKKSSFDEVISKFQDFCNKHSFDMAFAHVTKQHQQLYEKHGLTLQKIGEEAVVDLQKFTEHTANNKKWRHVRNKFDKLGYSFELRQSAISQTLISELKRVSDDWLETPGRTERGFVMGYFDTSYLSTCTIGILRNDEQQIVSFVNLVESFDPDEANMDLFRQRKGSPTNINDYMICQVLFALHAEGFERFNLGLCPLVGMDDKQSTTPINRALNLVYNYGGKIYSFKGLHQFKSKFEPVWRARFIAYEASAINVIRTAQALSAAMKVKHEK